MFREKISELVNLLIQQNEQEMAKDIDEIIRSCSVYIDRVVAMECASSILRFTMEAGEYRSCMTELDKNRRIAHNAVIANVKLLNRYCKLAGVDPIYTGDLESRIEMADFAGIVVKEYFDTRQL